MLLILFNFSVLTGISPNPYDCPTSDNPGKSEVDCCTQYRAHLSTYCCNPKVATNIVIMFVLKNVRAYNCSVKF